MVWAQPRQKAVTALIHTTSAEHVWPAVLTFWTSGLLTVDATGLAHPDLSAAGAAHTSSIRKHDCTWPSKTCQAPKLCSALLPAARASPSATVAGREQPGPLPYEMAYHHGACQLPGSLPVHGHWKLEGEIQALALMLLPKVTVKLWASNRPWQKTYWLALLAATDKSYKSDSQNFDFSRCCWDLTIGCCSLLRLLHWYTNCWAAHNIKSEASCCRQTFAPRRSQSGLGKPSASHMLIRDCAVPV